MIFFCLNLLTMGVAEPVAECQPRICDGRKPDIGVMSEPVQEESNLIADRPKISDQDTDQVNGIRVETLIINRLSRGGQAETMASLLPAVLL